MAWQRATQAPLSNVDTDHSQDPLLHRELPSFCAQFLTIFQRYNLKLVRRPRSVRVAAVHRFSGCGLRSRSFAVRPFALGSRVCRM